jgi:hypothetical protein
MVSWKARKSFEKTTPEILEQYVADAKVHLCGSSGVNESTYRLEHHVGTGMNVLTVDGQVVFESRDMAEALNAFLDA